MTCKISLFQVLGGSWATLGTNDRKSKILQVILGAPRAQNEPQNQENLVQDRLFLHSFFHRCCSDFVLKVTLSKRAAGRKHRTSFIRQFYFEDEITAAAFVYWSASLLVMQVFQISDCRGAGGSGRSP